MKIDATKDERVFLRRALEYFVENIEGDICGWGLDEEDERHIAMAKTILKDLPEEKSK